MTWVYGGGVRGSMWRAVCRQIGRSPAGPAARAVRPGAWGMGSDHDELEQPGWLPVLTGAVGFDPAAVGCLAPAVGEPLLELVEARAVGLLLGHRQVPGRARPPGRGNWSRRRRGSAPGSWRGPG